jgi:hypothetical protein
MATTTNYGWDTPDDTDLVKDGAAAIRTLGSSVDTTTKNLNPQTTTGAIAYRSATANVNTALPIGTAGQVLKVNSGATAPEWGAAAAGMTQLATGSLTGASVVISSISSSYKDLQLVVRNFLPATDDASLSCRVNQDSTASRHGNNTFANHTGQAIGATSWTIGSGQDNSVDKSIIVLNIYDYANALTWKMGNNLGLTVNATTTTYYNFSCELKVYNQTTAVSSLELFCSSGNFTSGTYILYGVS